MGVGVEIGRDGIIVCGFVFVFWARVRIFFRLFVDFICRYVV